MDAPQQPRCLEELLQDLTHSDEEVRLAALHELKRVGSLAALDAVRRVAGNDPSPNVRFEARSFLSTVSSRSSAAGAPSSPQPPAEAAAPPLLEGNTDLPDSKVQRLLFALRDPSSKQRLEAVETITGHPDRRLLGGVRGLLRDDDPAVRHGAREAARKILLHAASPEGDPARLARFERDLQVGGGPARKALTEVLEVCVLCGVSETADIVASHLLSEERTVERASMLAALALIGDSSIAPFLHTFLEDPDGRVRANAVEALDLIGGKDWVGRAVSCLADADPRVRAAALRASRTIYPEPFRTHLTGMLASPQVAERAAGLYVARSVEVPGRLALLSDHFLRETQPRLYEDCAEALAREAASSDDGEAITGLLDRVSDGDKRQCLLSALEDAGVSDRGVAGDLEADGEPGQDGASPARGRSRPRSFTQALDQSRLGNLTPEDVREGLQGETESLMICFYLQSAAQLGLPDAVDLARPFAGSRDRRVRVAVAEALGTHHGPEAGQMLEELSLDREEEVSRVAFRQLQQSFPEHALAPIRRLLESRQPWTSRRALDLVETLDTPEVLSPCLELLSRPPDPALVEPLARIIRKWGRRDTLEELSATFRAAPLASRPFLAELGSRLGEKLQCPPDVLAVLFPSEDTAGPRASRPGPVSEAGRAPSPLPWAAVAVAACVGMGAYLFWPASTEEAGMRSARVSRGTRGTSPRAAVARLERRSPRRPPSSAHPAVARAHVSREWPPAFMRPSLEEMKEHLRAFLSLEGLASDRFVEVLARDRESGDYRQAIDRARDALERGEGREALRTLQDAMDQLDPEHLVGRMTLLRELIATAQQLRMFELLEGWRRDFDEARTQLAEVCLEAAREGGLSEDEARQALAALEEESSTHQKLGRTSDFFSGARLSLAPATSRND